MSYAMKNLLVEVLLSQQVDDTVDVLCGLPLLEVLNESA